jgi:hypothetical protein
MFRSVRRARLCHPSSPSGAPHPACRARTLGGWHRSRLRAHSGHTRPAAGEAVRDRAASGAFVFTTCRYIPARLTLLPAQGYSGVGIGASLATTGAPAVGYSRLRARQCTLKCGLSQSGRVTSQPVATCPPPRVKRGSASRPDQPLLPHSRGPSVVAYARRGVRSPVRRAVSAFGGRCRNARWVSLRWSVCYGFRSCTRRVVGKHHVLCMQQPNPALKRTRREASSCFAGIVPARRLARSLGSVLGLRSCHQRRSS